MKEKQINLNQILLSVPRGTVLTSSWLKSKGISYRLQSYYLKKGLLKSIGRGAYVQTNSITNIDDGLNAINNQLGINAHIGAYSALTHGFNNYTQFIKENKNTEIFISKNTPLPKWFTKLGKYTLHKTNFLNTEIAITNGNTYLHLGGIKITKNPNSYVKPFGVNIPSPKISEPERAILEAIYLTPNKATLKNAYQILELMTALRPQLLQQLLENCSSIKVKRLFLYMAEKIGHDWFNYLNLSKIDLGSGKRVISKGGKFDKKYNIVIEDLDSI